MESSSNNGMIQPLIFLYMYLYAIVPEFFPTAKQGTFGLPLSAFLSQRATMIWSFILWVCEWCIWQSIFFLYSYLWHFKHSINYFAHCNVFYSSSLLDSSQWPFYKILSFFLSKCKSRDLLSFFSSLEHQLSQHLTNHNAAWPSKLVLKVS